MREGVWSPGFGSTVEDAIFRERERKRAVEIGSHGPLRVIEGLVGGRPLALFYIISI